MNIWHPLCSLWSELQDQKDLCNHFFYLQKSGGCFGIQMYTAVLYILFVSGMSGSMKVGLEEVILHRLIVEIGPCIVCMQLHGRVESGV